MRVVLFGGGHKGLVILKTLLELNEDVVSVFYFVEDPYELIWYEKVEDVATAKGIPAYNISEISKKDVRQTLMSMEPDVIFLVSWRYKIPKEQYSIPQKGCIVFHDSLLPKYRGFAPMNWAIINGEKQTGATMFYIADEVDSGNIIAQKAIDIEVVDDARILEEKIASLYVELLKVNLPLIKKGGILAYPQDHSQATYTCKRIPDDGLIDWSQSSLQIYNLVRGLTTPYPGAFSYVKGNKVYIWKTNFDVKHKCYQGRIYGRVVGIIKNRGVEVLTGDGSLVVEDISMEGQPNIVKADRVIKSIKTTLGRL